MFICIQSLHEIHRTQQCTKQLLCSSLFPMEQVKLMILTMEHNSHLQHCSEVCLPEGAHPSHFVAAAATDISLWMVSINWNHLTPDPEEHEVPSLTGSPVVLVICKLAGSNLPKCGGSGKLVTQSLMAGLDPEGFPSPTESVIWSMRDNEKILTWKFSPHWNWTVLPILISRVTTPAFIYIYIYILFFKLKQHFKWHQTSRYQTSTRKLIIAMPENSTPPPLKTLSPPWLHWPTDRAHSHPSTFTQGLYHLVATGANVVLHLLINSKKKCFERIHNCMPPTHVLSSLYTFHMMIRSFIQQSKYFCDVWLIPFPTHQGQQPLHQEHSAYTPSPISSLTHPDQKTKLNKNSPC